MLINELIQYIISSSNKADVNIASTFGDFLKDFESQLKEKAPVDTGEFKESWTSTEISGSGTLRANITNNHVASGAIEFGSAPGSSPWPSPGPKTVMSSGRIFSSQAVGGTINKVFNDTNVKIFAEKIANSIMRAFK
jgi:hypothetical protein